mmetsp:Transcript_2912/g.7084  ORF Transcript_2912/g.7084 Transcript_2912/m.7084 type:complete len:237 (+) Transcript_2912:292-1002(+)
MEMRRSAGLSSLIEFKRGRCDPRKLWIKSLTACLPWLPLSRLATLSLRQRVRCPPRLATSTMSSSLLQAGTERPASSMARSSLGGTSTGPLSAVHALLRTSASASAAGSTHSSGPQFCAGGSCDGPAILREAKSARAISFARAGGACCSAQVSAARSSSSEAASRIFVSACARTESTMSAYSLHSLPRIWSPSLSKLVLLCPSPANTAAWRAASQHSGSGHSGSVGLSGKGVGSTR